MECLLPKNRLKANITTTHFYADIFFVGFTTYMNMVHGMEMPPNQFWYCTIATTVLFISTLCSALFVISIILQYYQASQSGFV